MSSSSDTEAELLRRAIAGERFAMDRLLLAHFDRLAARIKVPRELQGVLDCEDIVQETLAEAWRHIATFQPEDASAFFGWLLTIAEHKLLDKIKAQRAEKRGGGRTATYLPADPDSSVNILAEQLAVDPETPIVVAVRNEQIEAIRAAVLRLAEPYRQVLQLIYLDGLSAAEVADRLSKTLGAIYMLCSRGKEMLRSILGESGKFFSSRS